MLHYRQEVDWEMPVLVAHALPHIITQICYTQLCVGRLQAQGLQLHLHHPDDMTSSTVCTAGHTGISCQCSYTGVIGMDMVERWDVFVVARGFE